MVSAPGKFPVRNIRIYVSFALGIGLLALAIRLTSAFLNSDYLFRGPSHSSQTNNRLIAINYLDGKLYPHHPVFHHVDFEPKRFEKGLLTEPNGLKVPAHYDCRNVNHNNAVWGQTNYFNAVPSRWFACWNYYGYLQSGSPVIRPLEPVIDEEYTEHVAVYDSVLKAKSKFVMAEIGARWGTWGYRAVSFLQISNPLRYELLLVDSDPVNCGGMRNISRINNIKSTVFCELAEPAKVVKWAANMEFIDVLDIDIQGAERPFFEDGDIMELVNNKVRRLIIGTHHDTIHDEMRAKFDHWFLQLDHPNSPERDCVLRFRNIAGHGETDRSLLDGLIKDKCYLETPFGKVSNCDGELILDNPKLTKQKKLFRPIHVLKR